MEAIKLPIPKNKRKSSSEDVYEIVHEGKTLVCDRVTNVLKATKSSQGLINWYGKLGTIEAEKVRDSTADVGKATHALIEQDLTGRKPGPDIAITQAAVRRFGHYLDWKAAHKVEPVPGYQCAEHTVYSPDLLVAGTLDLHLIVDGDEWIWDTKTGSAVRRDFADQVAIYTIFAREGRARALQDLPTLKMFKESYAACKAPAIVWPRMGILHITADGLCSWELNPDEREFYVEDFLHRLKSYRHDQTVRPFRRVWPCNEEKYLRGS